MSVKLIMKSDTRGFILQTASDLFYEKGYNLTGINEIIATAGIAKATLYHHFKSKEELCIAYLKSRDEALVQAIKDHCKSKKSGNDQLLGVLDFLSKFYSSGNFNGCWCLRTFAEIPGDNQEITKQIRKGKNELLDLITQLVIKNKPTLTKAKQHKLGRRIYLLYEGAVSESYLQGDDWPILESKNLLKEILT